MQDDTRLAAFEKMLDDVIAEQTLTLARMAALKAQGKEKSVTYCQLMADKLQYQGLITRYRRYGLIDREA